MNHYEYSELVVGQQESFSVEITTEMMSKFYSITGDCNPLHNDNSYARLSGYNGKVVYGMLTASFFSTMAGVYLPGEYSLIHLIETEFVKPVFIGDKLTVTATIKEKNDLFKTIVLKLDIRNQNEEKVCRGKMRIGIRK